MLEEILKARNSFAGEFLSAWNGASASLMELVPPEYRSGLIKGGKRRRISRLEARAERETDWEAKYEILHESSEIIIKGLIEAYSGNLRDGYIRADKRLSSMLKVSSGSILVARKALEGLEEQLGVAKADEAKAQTSAGKAAIDTLTSQASAKKEHLELLVTRQKEYAEHANQARAEVDKFNASGDFYIERLKTLERLQDSYMSLESSARDGRQVQFSSIAESLTLTVVLGGIGLGISPSTIKAAIDANRELLESEVAFADSPESMAIRMHFDDSAEQAKEYDAQQTRISNRQSWYVIGAASIALVALSYATIVGGKQGAVGPNGPQGNPGIDGVAGVRGPAGANGAQGPAGANGARGHAGDAGVAGVQGPAGANYALTEGDKTDIAGIVAAQISIEDNEALVGNVQKFVNEYLNANPQLFAVPTPVPTAAPTTARPTPAPTVGPSPTPTAPAPYQVPSQYTVPKALMDILKVQDTPGMLEALGLSDKVGNPLLDGDNANDEIVSATIDMLANTIGVSVRLSTGDVSVVSTAEKHTLTAAPFDAYLKATATVKQLEEYLR